MHLTVADGAGAGEADVLLAVDVSLCSGCSNASSISCSKTTDASRSCRWRVDTGMSDDQALDPNDDTLPPEHPAGSDAPVSAGEALSGEGIGTGAVGPTPANPAEPNADRLPDDDT